METTQVAAAAAEATNTAPPLIGEYWPGQGGIYIGVAAADGDLPQGHLVLAVAPAEGRLTWKKAVAWAKKQSADGLTDFRLPTRFEAALIYANGRSHVDTSNWHWTGTECAGVESFAWFCVFDDGYQVNDHKDFILAARAVRRFVL